MISFKKDKDKDKKNKDNINTNNNGREIAGFSAREGKNVNVRSTREQMAYLIIFVLFVAVSIFVDLKGTAAPNETSIDTQQLWTVETGEPADLDNIPSGNQKFMLDVSKYDIHGQALCMKSVDTTFRIFADGMEIYNYHPRTPNRFGLSYGMYVHTIALPDDTKMLTMKTEPIFRERPADLNDVTIDNAGHYMTNFFRENLFSFGQSAVIMAVGILFLLFGLGGAILMRSVGIDFIAFGAAFALIGFVGFNDTMILQVLTGRPELIRVLTYVCLIFLPFPVLVFFAGATGNSSAKPVSIVLVSCLVNFLGQVLLTYRGATDYFYLVRISHMMIFLDFAFIIWLVINAMRKKTIRPNLYRNLITGTIVCIIGVGTDLIRFSFFGSNGAAGYTRIAVLIFAIMIGSYLFRERIRSLEEKNRENKELVSQIAEAFAKVIDVKDKYTNGHSMRVAKYTAMLAKELGYDDDTVERYRNIALLHDVGKISIPTDILNKPGKLTDEEYELVKSHTSNGYELLKDIKSIPDLAVGAQAHHERPDGKGYPNGLAGENIPRVAQIIAIADCFDAMYSDRPYRRHLEFEKAVSIIKEVSGTQLTPDVVDAFLRLVEKGEFKSTFDNEEGKRNSFDNADK